MAAQFSVCMLASGSKGNAVYVSDGQTRILIDAGLSGKAISGRMASRHLDPAALDAIIVSHEHNDHIRGVGVLSRRYKVPVYITPATLGSINGQLGAIAGVHHFECGTSFCINSLAIHPFSISHDAQDPAGFTIQCQDLKIGIATDLGIATAMVRQHLKGCHLLVLEANHDPKMLETGPYPWPLKQRIKSRMGHLSNFETCELLRQIKHADLHQVVLAHLSETNNTPQAAYDAVRLALDDNAARLSVALQDVCGEVIRL